MTTSVKAASLAPLLGYYSIDFTAAGTLADKIGAFDAEWRSAIVQPSGAALEWRADGVIPTAGNGILIADGEAWIFENQQALLEVAQFIGGTARVQFFG